MGTRLSSYEDYTPIINDKSLSAQEPKPSVCQLSVNDPVWGNCLNNRINKQLKNQPLFLHV